MERILHLTLKKRWFDMILSGEKPEEYRENKPYWQKRLIDYNSCRVCIKSFDYVVFKNGYSKTARMMKVKWLGTQLGKPAFKWYGAETDKQVFVISLGEIVETQNI